MPLGLDSPGSFVCPARQRANALGGRRVPVFPALLSDRLVDRYRQNLAKEGFSTRAAGMASLLGAGEKIETVT
jgi:hypothetical protein